MNHLEEIIQAVIANGQHEERWNILLNTHFRNPNGFEKIEAWAKANGLSVEFDNHYHSCIFRAIPGQAK